MGDAEDLQVHTRGIKSAKPFLSTLALESRFLVVKI